MENITKLNSWDIYVEGTASQFQCDEIALGPWASYSLKTDPIHMVFALARYKFCARMLAGKDLAIEIGCGDGFGIPIMAQAVKHLHCVDWDERNLENCKKRLSHLKNVTYECANLNETPLSMEADAAFLVDVIEHLDPAAEPKFMENLCASLKTSGVLMLGTPNITASAYASPQSASQHTNLKSMSALRSLTLQYFKHAFMFGMNDEILHTGYPAMCHYLWSLGVEKNASPR